ncbi:MAG: acyl-CoA thioesterase [Steroidobacteraceae bacterium]
MADLGELLDLQRVGDHRFRTEHGQPNRNGAVFGGQLLGQALRAAQLAFADDRKPVHSMHASFENAADATRGIDYTAARVLEGSSESLWQVRAEQGGTPVLTATVAFGVRREGFAHATGWRRTPPMPEDLPLLSRWQEDLAGELSAHGRSRTRTYPQVEVRPVDGRRHLLVEDGPPDSEFWIRALHGDSGLPLPETAVLAYLSDYLAVNPVLAGHVAELPAEPLFVASLNHALWFHATPMPGEWQHHQLASPWAGGGRALCLGSIRSRDGQLLATFAQETLVRLRRG